MKPERTEVRNRRGFTLIEMLVVISIIAVLAAIALPVTHQLRPDPVAAASRQLADDLALARRRAIADHTTVYVLFMPSTTNLDTTTISVPPTFNVNDQQRMAKGQYNSYALYEKRQIGDQPGRHTEHFITEWRTLPAGTAIAPQKFGDGVTPNQVSLAAPFNYKTFYYGTNGFTFGTNPTNPNNTNSFARFPYIAFDYTGRLASPWEQWRPPYPTKSGGFDAVIPITRGRFNFQRTVTGYAWAPVSFTEDPPNRWTNIYNHVVIDGPTGRSRVDHQEL
jgi:prepilin-type N-terminal cleavage/methylation domain-containing protein